MSTERKVPAIPADLMQWLDEAFPEKCPDPDDTKREVWMKAGERRLVRRLLAHFKKQEQVIYVST